MLRYTSLYYGSDYIARPFMNFPLSGNTNLGRLPCAYPSARLGHGFCNLQSTIGVPRRKTAAQTGGFATSECSLQRGLARTQHVVFICSDQRFQSGNPQTPAWNRCSSSMRKMPTTPSSQRCTRQLRGREEGRKYEFRVTGTLSCAEPRHTDSPSKSPVSPSNLLEQSWR